MVEVVNADRMGWLSTYLKTQFCKLGETANQPARIVTIRRMTKRAKHCINTKGQTILP